MAARPQTIVPFKGGKNKKLLHKLNQMVDAINLILNASSDAFINVNIRRSSLALSLNINTLLARIPKVIPGVQKFRLTSVTGSFPQWSYVGQRVIAFDSSQTWPNCFVTDEVDVTLINTRERPVCGSCYPVLYPTGITVAAVSGAVSTTFGGPTASICKLRPLIVGDCVDVSLYNDQIPGSSGLGVIGLFEFDHSSQPD